MSVGFRIYTKINRPAKELIEGFKGIPVANIADNMGRISCIDTAIRPFNKVALLGSAFTVKAPLGDNLMFHKALDMAQAGDIIVIDGEGCMDHSLCGDIMFNYAKRKGIAGFLIDGCIRDADTLETLEFPVYARGIQPKGPYKNGPGEINVPVCIGGQVVCPGDIIVGDGDGVVIIKPADAKYLIEKATVQFKNEQKAYQDIANGTFDRAWVDKILSEKGVEIIDDYAKY
ncbi:MAG: hypothetical protein PWP27_1305 [Clostridiales bacterium]|jgi:RraA family protein|nr:hypothetical protein [Clostridiales bacterium]MDK2933495.1 hypothetical protein [Clostridiales bacterium]